MVCGQSRKPLKRKELEMSSQAQTTCSRIAKRMADAIATGDDDDGNPNMLLQTLITDMLIAAATGLIDLNQLARAELANRGVNADGKWIGFDAAARAWEVE